MVEYGVLLPDVVDGTGEFVCQYRESFPLAVFTHEAIVVRGSANEDRTERGGEDYFLS